MKYLPTQVDKDNSSWFANNMTVASLTEIELHIGRLRSLSAFKLSITYPISVIAGRNRSGKSTILAMAACAFHNRKDGFRLPDRRLPYYTFSDFFIQTSDEIPQEGIEIQYRILHGGPRKSKGTPDDNDNLWQKREKKKGGKWSNYARRVRRNVVFFGVQRVVPPAERSVSKSYRSYFSDQTPEGWENNVKEAVARILGTTYDSFKMKRYGKYRLPFVCAQGTWYSGFNMGAGENALFEILSTIYSTPPGTLLVIDEIELGLHEEAQRRLITELKILCLQRYIQVICTTHSPAILEAVPPEGRFYVDSFCGKTSVIPCISPMYAAGRLSGEKTNELDVYVEDGFAATLIESAMNNNVRKRVRIIPIGSPITIIRQMAARYKDRGSSECIAVLDGDKASQIGDHKKKFIEALERSVNAETESEWLTERLAFLPGKTWPERWFIDALQSSDLGDFANLLCVSEDELSSYLREAAGAAKHSEIHTLARSLSLDETKTLNTAAQWVARKRNDDFRPIHETVQRFLL